MGRTINITEDGLIAEEMRVIMEQMGVHEDNMHQVNYTKEFLCEFSSKYFGRDVCPSETLESILVPIIFGIIFVIGLIGNIIVILIISRNHRHKANRVYVLSLAASDMIFILFCVPFQAFIYTFPTWFFGRFLCKFCHFWTEVGATGSSLSLVALSIDRNLAVAIFRYPKARGNRRLLWIAVALIWITSIVFALPSLIIIDTYTFHGQGESHTYCHPVLHELDMYYTLAKSIGAFFIPLLIIFYAYADLLVRVKRQQKVIQTRRKRSRKEADKRTRMMFALVGILVAAFIICWLPQHTLNLFISFAKFQFTLEMFYLKITCHCLSFCQAMVNPLLYAFASKWIRLHIKKTIVNNPWVRRNISWVSRDDVVINSNESSYVPNRRFSRIRQSIVFSNFMDGIGAGIETIVTPVKALFDAQATVTTVVIANGGEKETHAIASD